MIQFDDSVQVDEEPLRPLVPRNLEEQERELERVIFLGPQEYSGPLPSVPPLERPSAEKVPSFDKGQYHRKVPYFDKVRYCRK